MPTRAPASSGKSKGTDLKGRGPVMKGKGDDHGKGKGKRYGQGKGKDQGQSAGVDLDGDPGCRSRAKARARGSMAYEWRPWSPEGEGKGLVFDGVETSDEAYGVGSKGEGQGKGKSEGKGKRKRKGKAATEGRAPWDLEHARRLRAAWDQEHARAARNAMERRELGKVKGKGEGKSQGKGNGQGEGNGSCDLLSDRKSTAAIMLLVSEGKRPGLRSTSAPSRKL